ncbi:Scavenger mRNA decapping enzyme C-term binding [Musa troglodytarum]|uniref:Scavenger mRNA decapping enzyme C-term binding n=1 Tax=Musa troglodytarum TaxID=320322 RepID=A0A9E7L971_9LILI|nr:Scavenger mRNA decapping enzyme C-term binding [Musa troglodytarum]
MAQRRLAVLSSHLLQTDPVLPSATHRRAGPVEPLDLASTSSCCAGGGDEEKGCVFCRIIRDESPAFKTHLHIIPRKAGDELWRSEVRQPSCRRHPIESNQEIAHLVNSIRHLRKPTAQPLKKSVKS